MSRSFKPVDPKTAIPGGRKGKGSESSSAFDRIGGPYGRVLLLLLLLPLLRPAGGRRPRLDERGMGPGGGEWMDSGELVAAPRGSDARHQPQRPRRGSAGA